MRMKAVLKNAEKIYLSEKQTAERLHFSAVCKKEGYPEDGSDENNTFAKFTPSADITMLVTNPNLFGAHSVGQEFYVDFVPV